MATEFTHKTAPKKGVTQAARTKNETSGAKPKSRRKRVMSVKAQLAAAAKAEKRAQYRGLAESETLKALASASGSVKLTTTVRLEPRISRGLKILQVITNRPANKIVNEALDLYIERSTANTEAELEVVLARLKEYRRSDPGFRKAIGAFVEAEATLGKEDPAEGKVIAMEAGPAVTMVRDLLRG